MAIDLDALAEELAAAGHETQIERRTLYVTTQTGDQAIRRRFAIPAGGSAIFIGVPSPDAPYLWVAGGTLLRADWPIIQAVFRAAEPPSTSDEGGA